MDALHLADIPREPLADSTTVYLSHSRYETYSTCGYRYYLQHEENWESKEEACALGFGNAVHAGCTTWLISTIKGFPCRPTEVFMKAWNDFCRTKAVDYGKVWTKEKLDETGIALVEAFVAWWPTSGLKLLIDAKGEPVVERKFKVKLPGNIIYTAIVDLMAVDANGRVLVLDIKTPAQLSMEGFALLNDQLLGYQIVADAFKHELGIDQVDGMGFIELHKVTVKDPPKKATSKPKIQPSVAPLEVAPRRSQARVKEWLQERKLVAADIRKRRFPRRPGDSFSSPCKLCGLYLLCAKSSRIGLVKREKRNSRQRVVLNANSQNASNTVPF